VTDRAQIDARQAVYAADILDTVAGLALTRDGAFGGITSIRMHSASSDKTLLLIDGVPQNDPSDPNGAYDLAISIWPTSSGSRSCRDRKARSGARMRSAW